MKIMLPRPGRGRSMRAVKTFGFVGAALMLAFATASQEEVIDPAETVQSVRDFLQDNVDQETLDALGVDQERVQKLLGELQSRFNGSYVFDLTALQPTATNLLPVLRQFEETQPYAAWLETRLDYFTTLEELRRQTSTTNMPPGGRLPNPPPEVERKVWVHELENEPAPPRAEKYVPRLKPIFAKEQVPTELVWLAEVESSFDPSARSPAGAVGLFQLMPATAKSLDLSLWPWDERRNPEKSARAAAVYLRSLHKRFDDWPLALAAYNAGEGRVSDLLRKRKARSFDAISDALPAETQMYVPKVEATVLKREGRTLAQLKSP